jgi:hypothetical protein
MINFDPDLVVAFLEALLTGDKAVAVSYAKRIVAQEESPVLEDSDHECYTDTTVLAKLIQDEYDKLAFATVREAYEEIAPKILGFASCYLHQTTEQSNGNPEPSSEPIE